MFGALCLGKEIFTAIQIFQYIAPANRCDFTTNKPKPLDHSRGLGLKIFAFMRNVRILSSVNNWKNREINRINN